MEEAEPTHRHFQGMYFSPVPCCWMDLGDSDPGEWVWYRWEWAECCICKPSGLQILPEVSCWAPGSQRCVWFHSRPEHWREAQALQELQTSGLRFCLWWDARVLLQEKFVWCDTGHGGSNSYVFYILVWDLHCRSAELIFWRYKLTSAWWSGSKMKLYQVDEFSLVLFLVL